MDQLVIFDVDGTLCNTSSVDDECFCATASAALDARIELSSWEDSPHITDLGIVEWLWSRHLGRAPARQEIDAFATKFEAALGSQLHRAPERFSAIAGALQFLGDLEMGGSRFIFATGGWARTARLKLKAAGLPVAPLLASSDDSRDRSEIFSLAKSRAFAISGTMPNRTVLVGDGTWDVRVARRLGWSFVGVGRDRSVARLRNEGADFVIPDFADRDVVFAGIRDCGVPRLANAPSVAGGAG